MDVFLPSTYFDLSGFEHRALFSDTEPLWLLLKKIGPYLSKQSLGNILGKVEEGAFLVNPEKIFIGKNTVVEAGAYIMGPCVIGDHCEIRHGAYLRGNVIVGPDCVIGHATEVKNSIFLPGATAGHFAYVGDSIVGRQANLGAGTKLANLRFDKKSVVIEFEGQKYDTGLRKFGAILGDDSQTGCNAVTNPGTLMGKKSLLAACTTAKGVILNGQFVRAQEASLV